MGQHIPSFNSKSTHRLLSSQNSSTTPLPQHSNVTPPGVGQHSPVKLDAVQIGFTMHCDESGSILLGTSDWTSDGTVDSARIFKLGDKEGDEVGISDAISVGCSVGTTVLVGTVVGVSATANDGALVGTSVVGFVVLTVIGARDGAIVLLFVVVTVGVDGKILPPPHPSIKSCKYGLIVPF